MTKNQKLKKIVLALTLIVIGAVLYNLYISYKYDTDSQIQRFEDKLYLKELPDIVYRYMPLKENTTIKSIQYAYETIPYSKMLVREEIKHICTGVNDGKGEKFN